MRSRIQSSIGLVAAVWTLLLAGCGELEPADSITPLRLPVGVELFNHQTFNVVELAVGPESVDSAAFDVHADADATVEFGVLRGLQMERKLWRKVRKAPPGPRSYRVQFWRQAMGRPSLLLRETVDLAVNEPVMFRIDGERVDAAEEPARIVCEIEALGDGESDGDDGSGGETTGSETVAVGDDESEIRELVACLEPAVLERRRPREWNVVMVSSDTLRPDHLSAYGYHRETSPNLDDLAARGVLFTQAISPAPWTTPAHYSLFTGLNPTAHQNNRSAAEPFRNDQTLARRLRDHGYYTLGITGGGSISSRFGMANGFNVYREYSSYPNTTHPDRSWKHRDDTRQSFDDAEAWLEANADTRFFLFLHHFECHDPYEGEHFANGESGDDLITRRRALYDGDIRRADAFFGRLVDKLRQLDLLANTILVFLSDHGEEFHEHYVESDVIPPRQTELVPEISYIDHAHSLYDELLRVPLIFYIPGLEPKRRVLDNQVRLIDVMPTILDLLDVAPKGPIQGESLVPLMRSGERERDPPALAESTYWGPERKAIRMDGYKYIWIPDLESKTKRTYKGIEQFELFDLVNDPGETKNLYHQRPEQAEKLHHALLGELKESLDMQKRLQQRRPGSGQEIEVEDDVLEALQALGYLD